MMSRLFKKPATPFCFSWRIALLMALFGQGLGAPILLSEQPPNILLILADNWRWPNAGVYGDKFAQTPTFDRIAREGVLFTHTFNPVPSCSPTRACLLTGKTAHQLGERANLWSGFPKDDLVVTQRLREVGYQLGYSGKPWAPGNHEISGWTENPVGPKYSDFRDFLAKNSNKQPFFFWLGNTDTATKAGRLPYIDLVKDRIKTEELEIPPELPNCPEVRQDLLNYYGGIQKLDEEATEAMRTLEANGLLEKTVVIYASDNGWQLPRGLANCYDAGSRVPLAIRWGAQVNGGRVADDFVNVGDLGPTCLELAGLAPPAEMTMRSLKPLLLGEPSDGKRDAVFMERERHADVRKNHLSYPMRAIRTKDWLYVRNLRPDRWPAGDPDVYFLHGRPFGDVDTTAVKDFLLAHLKDPKYETFQQRIFGKRPAEELYDLRADPHQLNNVATNRALDPVRLQLRQRLDAWMHSTHDPRIDDAYNAWDEFPYYGKPAPRIAKTEVTIQGDSFHLNGQPTYAGKTWRGAKIEGLLLNSRMVQATFDDLNPETRDQWAYPDTGTWDAERNVREFIAALPAYREHGLLAFTINLQGGSPQGYSREQPWHNSAFKSDGSLRTEYIERLDRVIAAADQLGMVVIVGYFYFGQDQRLADETAVIAATDAATHWLLDRGYRNVIVEVNNECDVKSYDHAILKPDRVHELIERVKRTAKGRYRLLVGTSYGGGSIPEESVVRASDFLLLHGNGVKQPRRIGEMVAQTRAVPGYRQMPILFNEDDHFAFDQPENNFAAAVKEHVSWGFFDYRMRGEGFDEGFQSVPVNWGISSDRKRGFFGLLKEITQ